MGQLPRIFLIRHGETEWNRQGRFQGRKNSAPTEDGRKQVERIGRRLALDIGRCGQEFAAVCSPLGRCIESAKILSECVEVSWKLDDRLVEFTANSWDGALTREIQAELGVDPPQIYACLDRIGGYLLEQGVSIRAVDIGSDWAEMEDVSRFARFVLSTKSETLARLSYLVKRARFCEQQVPPALRPPIRYG